MAYTQLEQNFFDEAVSSIRRYRALQPDTPNTMDSEWEILTGTGRLDEAITQLDRALLEHPEWTGIYWRLLYSNVVGGDTTSVEELLDKIDETSSEPEIARPYRASHAALAQGRWNEARVLSSSYLRAARRIRSDSLLIGDLRNHAAVLHATGDHDDAERILEEAVEISMQVYDPKFNPIPVPVAYQNGLGYADMGDIDRLKKAIDDITVALEAPGMDGRHAIYFALLSANLALLNGDLNKTKKELDAAYWPVTISHSQRMQARLAGLNGDVENALFRYHLVQYNISARGFGISAFPSFFIDLATVHYETARMFDDRGDREEAIRRYQIALDRWESVGADFRFVALAEQRLRELRAGG